MVVCVGVCGIVYSGLCSDDASGVGAVGGDGCIDDGFGVLGWFFPPICFVGALGGVQPIFCGV